MNEFALDQTVTVKLKVKKIKIDSNGVFYELGRLGSRQVEFDTITLAEADINEKETACCKCA